MKSFPLLALLAALLLTGCASVHGPLIEAEYDPWEGPQRDWEIRGTTYTTTTNGFRIYNHAAPYDYITIGRLTVSSWDNVDFEPTVESYAQTNHADAAILIVTLTDESESGGSDTWVVPNKQGMPLYMSTTTRPGRLLTAASYFLIRWSTNPFDQFVPDSSKAR